MSLRKTIRGADESTRRHFLSGTNLSETSINVRCKIDLKRFLFGCKSSFVYHNCTVFVYKKSKIIYSGS